MIEISKELLSEVMNYNVDKYTIVSCNETTQIRIFKKDAEMWDYKSYDIHHMAHKCKEWALSKDYHINTSEDRFNNYLYLYKMFKDDFGYSIDKNSGVQFDSNDYINDLIKACEWILTKSNKKD